MRGLFDGKWWPCELPRAFVRSAMQQSAHRCEIQPYRHPSVAESSPIGILAVAKLKSCEVSNPNERGFVLFYDGLEVQPGKSRTTASPASKWHRLFQFRGIEFIPQIDSRRRAFLVRRRPPPSRRHRRRLRRRCRRCVVVVCVSRLFVSINLSWERSEAGVSREKLWNISSSILRKRKEMRLSTVCIKIRKSPGSVGHDIDWCAQLRYVHACYNITSATWLFLAFIDKTTIQKTVHTR